MAKGTVWRCAECGHGVPKWLGVCPECGGVGTFSEEAEVRVRTSASAVPSASAAVVSLGDLPEEGAPRTSLGIPELDRVLGGGLVEGSLVLLGGEPGIGKSTLLLHAAQRLAEAGTDVLYVCGEESPRQVGLRARRLGVDDGRIGLLSETDADVIEATVRDRRPGVLLVDSVQTLQDPLLDGAPGSPAQVRACAARLARLAKELPVATVLVGHVTKDGGIAGPRVLEHMVDTVLYFEGDRDRAFRVVRAVKNRFGSVSEVGIFEMTEEGLVPVASPSALLSGDGTVVPGCAVMAAMEGSRALLVEVQALVNPTSFPPARRLANGIDNARLLQLLAVLERRAGLAFGSHDVYVSVAGGIRVGEPAADLAVALALASALRDQPLPSGMVSFGELGLSGELRQVPHAEARLREAAGMGFRTVVMSDGGRVPERAGLELVRVPDLASALRATEGGTELAAG